MSENMTYGFNEKKEKVQVYSKDEVDKTIDEVDKTIDEVDKTIDDLPKVYSGTEEPNSNLGKDGDIYFQYM